MAWMDGCPLECGANNIQFQKWFGCGLVIVDRAVGRAKQKSNWLHASYQQLCKFDTCHVDTSRCL